MSFCLPKFAADALLKSLPEDLSKLTDATSEERRAFFADIVGEENAKHTNALFESKLLLKDQQQGIINWVKKLTGITPEIKQDIISKAQRMTDILQPKDKTGFLEDLASRRLGTDVTVEEAGKIADLAKNVETAKIDMQNGGDRMNYGRAKVAFSNYVNGLKLAADNPTLSEMIKHPVDTLSSGAGQVKAIKASLDNSAIFRQGWKTMLTHPGIWAKNALKSFANIAQSLGGKEVTNEVNAEISSRPNYEKMTKAKLAVGTLEEAFPTALPEKIPLFGRLYKASEVGFNNFIHQLRADVFDKYIEIANDSGIDTTDKTQLESIGNLVNSLTGRGSLGRLEPVAGVINNVFFSPRFLKSQIDTISHAVGVDVAGQKVTSFARKQAAVNLVKIVAGQAAIMALANILQPGSAETDPRSSDFGKIRVGDTRFDVSGGGAAVVTLAARLLSMSSKSSTTGKINPINSGKFGAQTGTDVVYNFFENKLSPAASVVKDLLKGQDFNGNKPTFLNELNNVVTPLPITNFFQTKGNDKAANLLAVLLADGLGIGANTYSPPKKK